MVELSRVPTGSRHTMILAMLPLISWAYVQRMLEPTQLLLEMHLERHNWLQQWKWKVSECNCDQICCLFLVVDMSRFISRFCCYSQGSCGTGVFERHVACVHVTVLHSDTTVCYICTCNCPTIPGEAYKVMYCITRKGKVRCLSTPWSHTGMAPLILNLAAGWRWVVSIMPWPLLPWKSTLLCIEYEPGWSLELVWTFWRYILKCSELMKMWKSKITM